MTSFSVKTSYKGEEYKTDLAKLQFGQFIDIETLKGQIAANKYNFLNSSVSGTLARYAIDAIAFFTVIWPKSVEGVVEISMLEAKDLILAYVDDILPVWSEYVALLNATEEMEEKVNEES